jgi:protein-S-isoprenylcysteine O-methyltransferase Ste14
VGDWYRIARRVRVPLGFAFAVFYLRMAKPSWASIAWASLLLVAGLLIRAVASGHVQKDEQLTTSGPYAYVRNPLYLGSVILAVGLAIASRSWWIALGMALLFVVVYLPVIISEENFLRSNFPAFTDYAQHVPRLVPRFPGYHGSVDRSFSAQLYWKHREYNALLGTIGVLVVLIVKLWFSR